MTERVSAGLVMYRCRAGRPEFFLAHPGGPFAGRKDEGYWSIPKGQPEAGEDLLDTARREFREEVGLEPPAGREHYHPVGSIRQKGGKLVHAWAFAGDWEEGRQLASNSFRLEWPPGSGQIREFPEVDRVGFFPLPEARWKIKDAQYPLLERTLEHIQQRAGGGREAAAGH